MFNYHDRDSQFTLASELTAGLLGKSIATALRIVFCSSMADWDISCPNGYIKLYPHI